MAEETDILKVYNQILSQSTMTWTGVAFTYMYSGNPITPYQMLREACRHVRLSKYACEGFKSLKSYEFADTGGSLVLNDDMLTDLSGAATFTVVVPIRLVPDGSKYCLFSIWTESGDQRQFAILVNADGSISVQYSKDGTAANIVAEETTSKTLLNESGWKLLMVTYDNAASPRINIYVNGVAAGTSTTGVDGNIYLSTASPLVNGLVDGTGEIAFTGNYDLNYFAIYDSVLSSADADTLYNDGDFLGPDYVAGSKYVYLFDNDTAVRVVEENGQYHGSLLTFNASAENVFPRLTDRTPYTR